MSSSPVAANYSLLTLYVIDYFFRSSRHCSDVGKLIGCPIIHVNADNPEVSGQNLILLCRFEISVNFLVFLRAIKFSFGRHFSQESIKFKISVSSGLPIYEN